MILSDKFLKESDTETFLKFNSCFSTEYVDGTLVLKNRTWHPQFKAKGCHHGLNRLRLVIFYCDDNIETVSNVCRKLNDYMIKGYFGYFGGIILKKVAAERHIHTIILKRLDMKCEG